MNEYQTSVPIDIIDLAQIEGRKRPALVIQFTKLSSLNDYLIITFSEKETGVINASPHTWNNKNLSSSVF